MSALAPLMKPMRTAADKCIVYWDYENMPIPKQANFKDISTKLKPKLWSFIGTKLPIEYKVYIRASKVTKAIDNDFDTNGVTVIHVPSLKPEAVDKRLMIDMMFTLYELERDNKSRAIALISGDKDFGHLLSKMHHTPPVPKSFLILLRNSNIDENLTNVVDHVIYPLNSGAAVVGNKHSQIKSQPKHKAISVDIIHLLDAKNKFKFKGRAATQLHAVADVICQKKGVKKRQKQQLKLFHYGKDGKENILLNHQDTFKKCKVKEGHSIAWYLDESNQINVTQARKGKKVSSKKEKIHLKFEHINSDLGFQINTKRSNTIKNLRLTCYAQSTALNIPKEHYVLYHDGIKLEDRKKISNYNIKDGDKLIWDGDETNALSAVDRKQKTKKHLRGKIKITFVHQDKIYNDVDFKSTLVNSLHNLKQKIVHKFSLNVDEQCINIIFNGKVLDRKKTLRQCGITQDAILVWNVIKKENEHKQLIENIMMKYEDEDEMVLTDHDDENDVDVKVDAEYNEIIKVEVKNEMNATTLFFTMKKENTILDIKKMIEQRVSMNPTDQILKFNGNILKDEDDGDCLARSGFTNGDKLYLTVNISNICIDIEVLGGQIIKNMPCRNDQSVLELKKEIKDRCGLNIADQVLKYKENNMLNCYYLYNYGISNGSLIRLTVKE